MMIDEIINNTVKKKDSKIFFFYNCKIEKRDSHRDKIAFCRGFSVVASSIYS